MLTFEVKRASCKQEAQSGRGVVPNILGQGPQSGTYPFRSRTYVLLRY